MLQKAQKFLKYAIGTETVQYVTPFIDSKDVERTAEDARQKETAQKKYIVDNPLQAYSAYANRLQQHGLDASFPEFSSAVTLLRLQLLGGEEVKSACMQSDFMSAWREDVLQQTQEALTRGQYKSSILAIESALEFLDVLSRGVRPETPALYHSDRYEYYFHYLLHQTDHVLFPTTANLGATDLIKLRGVPLGMIGVNVEDAWVDGFMQTPYEFFHHDINHTRRMFQFLSEDAAKKEQTIQEYAADSSQFVANTLLPTLRSSGSKQNDPALRMLLFEILHEDALAAAPDVIQNALFRPALARTPFEEMNGDHVTYLMEEGATTLSYVFRKLGHTFYDRPTDRSDFLGGASERSRLAIIKAAGTLLQAVCGSAPTEEQMSIFEQLTVTDRGFPDAFFAEVKKDIALRAGEDKDGTDFGFLITEPVSADEAVRAIRRSARGVVHALFGYSALGYEYPDVMLQTVRQDLVRLDPETTSVLIGATKEGIGAGYKVARELGFTTLGLVSSKSIAYGGEYSPYVDTIVVVEDTSWGGLDKAGRPTPTTQAFIGASDSFASYGGGDITKATLALARQKGTPVSSKAFAPAAR
jgi:hypothetical protein